MFKGQFFKCLVLASLSIGGFIGGCAGSETTVCNETGRTCPSGTQCVSQGQECALLSCGNGIAEPGEECDDGKNDSLDKGDKCSATCLAPLCGNGRQDFNEVCDPTDTDGGNTCNLECTSDGTCGNGIHDEYMGEECDGKDLPAEFELFRCSDRCTIVRCGNQAFEPEAGEECDPTAANDPTPASKCNSDCTLSVCGDSKIGPDELCDPGKDENSACECTKIEGCGNGLKDEGEECDPSPEVDGLEVCAPNCTLRRCGNNYIDQIGEFNEACDDGNTSAGDGCSANCESKEFCGNGVVDRDFPPKGEDDPRWETCDDGNRKDGDTCSANCKILAACGNGQWDPGEEMGCDTGKAPSGEEGRTIESKECNPDCSRRVCGDGFKNVTAGEDCDPNASVETATCNGPGATRPDYTSVECKTPRCGDQYVNAAAGETCEPLGDVNQVNDSATCNGEHAPSAVACRLVTCGDGYVNEAAGEHCEPSVDDTFDAQKGDSALCNSATAPQNVRCQANVCGDGYINSAAGEVCDDGQRDTRECNQGNAAVVAGKACMPAVCGDGYVNVAAGEQCDGGPLANNANDWDDCNGPNAPLDLRCKTRRCGDGYVHQSECGEVDSLGCNGATAPSSVACSPGGCGDGYVNAQSGERCDPSAPDDSAICNGPAAGELACQLATCGDGYTNDEAGEDCDPGDPTPASGGISSNDEKHASWNDCNGPTAFALQCKDRKCGDGFAHPDEECDVGNADTAVCNSAFNAQGQPNSPLIACTRTECGDGYVNAAAGEQCDPGSSTLNGDDDWDGCNGPNAGAGIACHLVRCGDGYVHKSECDEQETTLCNGSSAPPEVACKAKSCGDEYINRTAGEECDLGSTDSNTCNGSGAGNVSCKAAQCGDGHRNVAAGEDCDQTSDSLTCNRSGAGDAPCQTPTCGDRYTNTVSLSGTDAAGVAKKEGCDNGPADTPTCNGSTGKSSCQLSACGDGRLNTAAGEECDPSVAPDLWPRITNDPTVGDPSTAAQPNWEAPANACNPDGPLACKRTRCGDGYVNVSALQGQSTPFEQCDPAASREDWYGYSAGDSDFPTVCNTESAGSLKCKFAGCGDGIISTGEECDPDHADYGPMNPVTLDSEKCNGPNAPVGKACTKSECGDGYLNTEDEECDRAISNPACTTTCRVSSCGDGVVDSAHEECDVVYDSQGDPHWYFCNPPTVESEAADVQCLYSECGDGFLNTHTEYCTGQTKDHGWQELCDTDCP